MPRLVWSILCKTILTDQETGSVSYIESIEEGQATKLPTDMPPISIGTLWENNQTNVPFSVKITFKSPSGQEVNVLSADDILIEKERIRLNALIKTTHISEIGRHEFHVSYKQNSDWKTVSVLPLIITLVPKVKV